MKGWDPTSIAGWTRALGVVPVPLFDIDKSLQSRRYVLLDGQRATFGLSLPSHSSISTMQEASWAWSAHLNHYLVVDAGSSRLLVHRWDAPTRVQQLPLPQNETEARRLLHHLEGAPPPRLPDVIAYLLQAFDLLRSLVPDPVDAIHVFNALLLATDLLRNKRLDTDSLRSPRISDLFATLEPHYPDLLGPLRATSGDLHLGALPEVFFRADPVTGCYLEPALLLRHASSYLYQQAHLSIERDPQLSIPGLRSPKLSKHTAPREVRFTPPSLARALVQQALDRVEDLHDRHTITILDPACGSGVFLLEAYRELTLRNFSGHITLSGFDISPIAISITKFCLRNISTMQASNVTVRLDSRDALAVDWGSPDLILMNPPFVFWHNMTTEQKSAVREILRDLAVKTPDLAMVFIWKALHYIPESGLIVSLLPSPLLESTSGLPWRHAIANRATLELLGRFENPTYFLGATVEPAFLLLSLAKPNQSQSSSQIVLAKKGYENAALRSLRRDPEGLEKQDQWDTFRTPSHLVMQEDWTPHWRQDYIMLAQFARTRMPRVANLFDVKQGTRTGQVQAFILTTEQLLSLPERERQYFKPIADNATIRGGQIHRTHFVFFPYSESGDLVIESEEKLRSEVPEYTRGVLSRYKEQLKKRSRVKDIWWRLSERRAWQRKPKIVSTYFGDRGSFSYDSSGEFVVVQGWGWLWSGGNLSPDEKLQLSFEQTALPWAYLAVLNSSIFSRILAIHCPKVRGGQFNLSAKFLEQAYIPDLSDDARVRSSLVRDLAALGREIVVGGLHERQNEVDELALGLYGTSGLGNW